MKKVTKFFIAALLAGMCSLGYGQEYLGAPQKNEKVLEVITLGHPIYRDGKKLAPNEYESYSGCSILDWYAGLLEEAKRRYPNKTIDIREMSYGENYGTSNGTSVYRRPAVGKVVDLRDPETQTYGNLSQALNKALRNVREGSRMAIDQVSVTYGMDKEALKDQLLDVLLDKGYKVIAKEYLEKLYEEQEAQQSGIYNENTTVKDNNFSAVGYYINVKVTETSLRVQVVNVSTGEYEGNATVNF